MLERIASSLVFAVGHVGQRWMSRLLCPEYLQENHIEQWSMVSMDMALVKALPGITKHLAH